MQLTPGGVPVFKQPIWECKSYRDFVRGLPCMCISRSCTKLAPSNPHHERFMADGGTALKPSDVYLLPMCTPCHNYRHSSKFTMADGYFTRSRALMLRNLARFLSGMTVRRKP
jgi:hypothetical protein